MLISNFLIRCLIGLKASISQYGYSLVINAIKFTFNIILKIEKILKQITILEKQRFELSKIGKKT